MPRPGRAGIMYLSSFPTWTARKGNCPASLATHPPKKQHTKKAWSFTQRLDRPILEPISSPICSPDTVRLSADRSALDAVSTSTKRSILGHGEIVRRRSQQLLCTLHTFRTSKSVARESSDGRSQSDQECGWKLRIEETDERGN